MCDFLFVLSFRLDFILRHDTVANLILTLGILIGGGGSGICGGGRIRGLGEGFSIYTLALFFRLQKHIMPIR